MKAKLLLWAPAALLAILVAAPAIADFELERELQLAPGGRFELDTDSGSLQVRGGEHSGVRVRITSSRTAAEIEERYEIRFDESEGRAAIRVRRRGKGWFSSHREHLRFEIEVPTQTDLELDTSGGSVEVERVTGRVELETSGGHVEIRDVIGDVDAHTSGGSMEATNIDGEARLRTSGGRVEIDGVSGELYADSSGGGIYLKGIGGYVDASTSGGPVTAYLTKGNAKGGSLSTSGGSVTVYVDPEVGLDVDASTSGGSVSLDVPVMVRGRLSRSSISGALNGGGPTLRLRSSGGSIHVKSL